MGDLLFRIKRDDAAQALQVLWLDETVSPERLIEALEILRADLDTYILQLQDEHGGSGDSSNGSRSNGPGT